MSVNPASRSSTERQNDRLLWLAGAVLGALGVTWLLISQPWSSASTPALAISTAATASAPPSAAASLTGTNNLDTAPVLSTNLDNPLRMAELAYDAGMLIEPEDYSAWTLFASVLRQEPDNAAARAGLQKVADDLVQRGSVALEQGRYDDASAMLDRIFGTLPDHTGALELQTRLEALRPKPEPPPAPEPERVAVAAPAPAPVREEPKVDPVVVAHAGFESALAANRILTPPNDNARHYVELMIAAAPSNAQTRTDRDLLVTELLARSEQSLEALDTDGARAWIDAAEPIAANPAQITAARTAWTNRIIAMETAKPMPASALKLVKYVPPEFPRNAAMRGIEGWVDVEFTVAADGTTRDISAADASHERMFRTEAIAAVSQWTFEPRIFMERPIDQRVHTRVRFVFADN
ncbi:MAG TPA: TonB family protein [Gammaproteobacteria bacterium]